MRSPSETRWGAQRRSDSHLIFLSRRHLRIPPLWNCCFYVWWLLRLHEIPLRLRRLNCLITKTCSRCSELSEALWRDLIESISNKTSLLVFPFLNTPKGTAVMQFPSTLRPLAAAAGALPSSVGCCFIATSALWWGGGGGPAFSMSEPGHRSPWTSTPALHYLLSASIPAGGHVSE